MKKLILFIGLILPMFGLGQEKKTTTDITLCFGVGPIYCYYGHNVWIITPGLLNDPDWDLRTMSIPERRLPKLSIGYDDNTQRYQNLTGRTKSKLGLENYQFQYKPEMLAVVSSK